MLLRAGLTQSLHETYEIATHDDNRMFGGLVVLLGLLWASGIYLVLQQHSSFTFHEPGVAVWNEQLISVAKYPKQQDTLYYLLALILLPCFSLLCWAFWLFYSTVSARLTGLPAQTLLRWDTLTFLPSIFIVTGLPFPESTFSQVLLLPCLLFVGMKATLLVVVILFRRRVFGRKDTLHARRPTAATKSPPPTDSSAVKTAPTESAAPSLRKPRLPSLFAPPLRQAHWYPIAAGLCVGVFLLVEYGYPSLSFRRGCGILAASSIGLWLFWLAYSKLVSVLLNKPIQRALLSDAPTYLPAMLLLLQTVLFATSHADKILLGLAALLCIIGKCSMLWKDMATRNVPLHSSGHIGDTINRIAPRLLIGVLVPALIWAFLYNSNIHGALDAFHEGERLGPASDFLRGKIPYRDIYVQHGLFQNVYKTWLAFKLFGVSLSADRSLSNNPFGDAGFLTPLGFVAAYYLALAIYRKKLAAIITLMLLPLLELWLTERYALAFLAFAAIASFVDKKAGWKLWVAGIITALAMFNSLETGLYTLFASGLFLLIFALAPQHGSMRERLLLPGRFTLGVFAGFIPFLIYFWIHGALYDVFWVSYTVCVYQVPIWGLPFPNLLPELAKLVSLDAWRAFPLTATFKWYLPVLVYAIALTRLSYLAITRRFEHADWKLVLLLIAGITFFRSALGRSDHAHLIFATPPLWLLCIALLERPLISTASCLRESRTTPEHFNTAIQAVLTALLLLAFGCYVFAAYKPLQAAEERLRVLTSHGTIPDIGHASLSTRGGGALVPQQQADMLERVVEYIHTHTEPDEYIFDFTNHAAYYFLTNRPNPTRYYLAAYAATEEMQREVVADLQRRRPKYVLAHPDENAPSGFAGGNTDDQVIIGEYLRSHYRKEAGVADIAFLRRIQAE
jgi:hypothetical protein